MAAVAQGKFRTEADCETGVHERRPDRDDVLGRGRWRDLQAVDHLVWVVVKRRSVEQIGPPREGEMAAVLRIIPLVPHRDEHHVVQVIHQKEIDLAAGQRIGSVRQIDHDVVEIRSAERHDVQVNLSVTAGDARTRAGSAALRADRLVQAVGQEPRRDIAPCLDEFINGADGGGGGVLHEDARPP